MELWQPADTTANLGFSLSNHVVHDGKQPNPDYVNESAINDDDDLSDWERGDSGQEDEFNF